jgi:hypothetical protein
MLGILRFLEEDAAIIDLEQATLTGAWLQHQAVKERLAERQLAVTPADAGSGGRPDQGRR